MFKIVVNKNQLTLQKEEVITSGSVNVDEVQFEFSDHWNDLERVAIFRTSNVLNGIKKVLDETNKCKIPWEVLTIPGCFLYVGVYGTDNDEIVLTTEWLKIQKVEEGATLGNEGTEPTIPGFITEETDPTVPQWVKAITEEDINNWNSKTSSSGSGGSYDDTELRQLLNSKADTDNIPTNLADLTSDETHRTVSDVERQIWNNKSNFSGNYNDLDNKPTIPTKTSELQNDSEFLTQHQDISGKLTEPTTGLEVGKYFRIASIDENGHAVLECVDAPSSAMKLKIAGTAQTSDSDGYVNVPIASMSTYGAIKIGSGLKITNNSLYISPASNANINNRNSYYVIDSKIIDYAVKQAMTDGLGTAWTDTEKQRAWTRQNIIKTTLDSVLVPLAQYYLGEQTTFELTLPTTASAGQIITVDFASGTTATTLTITGNVAGDITYAPTVNTLVEINFKYDGTYWKMSVSSINTPE